MNKIMNREFVDLFFQAVRENPSETYEAIFHRMNEAHRAMYGAPRYSSFDSFRHVRDKIIRLHPPKSSISD